MSDDTIVESRTKELSMEEIQLILNCLVYSDSIDYKITDTMSIQVLISTKGFLPADGSITTPEEWKALVNTIKTNPDVFSKIQIVDVEDTDKKEKNVTFINYNTSTPQVYVVYKGTGSWEWHDNAQGGTIDTKITPQQQNAVDYANKIADQYPGLDLYVSGHSKGGNKAQVATILVDRVKQGFSFDGQGVGRGFMLYYKDLVTKNKYKLTSISNSADFVNPMFISIAGKTIYTKSDKAMIERILDGELDALAHQHSPNSMMQTIGGQLYLRNTFKVERDPMADFLGNLLDYFSDNMSEADFEIFINFAMHMMEQEGCSETDFDLDEIPPSYWLRLLTHLDGFFDELGITKEEKQIITSNLNVLMDGMLPNEAIYKFLEYGVKIGTTFYNLNVLSSILFCFTGKDATRDTLNGIVGRYNNAYELVRNAKENIHDFSYGVQEAMRSTLKNEINTNDLEINNLTGYTPCEDLLFKHDVLSLHGKVKNEFIDLLESEASELTRYNTVVDEVCSIDYELAQEYKTLGELLQEHTKQLKC